MNLVVNIRRRHSLVVKPQLPKLKMRVRFPLPAPLRIFSCEDFRDFLYLIYLLDYVEDFFVFYYTYYMY